MGGPRASAEVRRQQILAAAKRCFQRKGYVLTTMDEIAAEYRMSKGSIYWYYPSKKAVLLDLFQVWVEETMNRILTEIEDIPSARDKLIAMGEFFLRSLQEDIELYSALVVFWESSFLDASIREMLLDQYHLYDRLITGFLDDGENAGEFVVSDKKTYATLMIAMMEGIVVRQVLSKDLDLEAIRGNVAHVMNRLLPHLSQGGRKNARKRGAH
ncbi:MAG TPA: TetR/AcrR family transcriptional regulator [Deltaproteobacteria bacterium]|nr:TetR/AcrR family transcriptional regulator [Deltaproteobacteria bacterium]HPR56094.1 TetR/AcrR family transcriptional regulator [Deltaproteobacteria bacterium]HXK46930.1 TetR/AcrR family transcriptional regulator [Deltaproteobacteria bacterium]